MFVTKSSTARNLLLEQNLIKMTEQLVENPNAYLLVNPLYAAC